MKKLTIIFCLMCLTASLFADRYVARHEDIKTFLASTTYVVLEDNPMSEYNLKMKESIEKSWTITPYKFITVKEFEETRNDITKSFLVKLKLKFTGDKFEASYYFMSVVLGAAVKKHTDLPDICSLPLGYVDVPEENYAFKIESLIRFTQNHIKKLDSNPKLIKKDIFKQYNANKKQIKEKELWVLERDLEKSVRSLADVRKNYPHTIKIVSQEDIEKAIAEKNDKVIYLHKVGPEGGRLQARCYKLLIGAGSDQLYYFNMHMISNKNDGFLAKDLKSIK